MLDYQILKVVLSSGVTFQFNSAQESVEIQTDGKTAPIVVTTKDFDSILKTYAFMHKVGV